MVVLFVLLFGYPSIQTYLKGSIIEESGLFHDDVLEYPAITFCVDQVDAWKENNGEQNVSANYRSTLLRKCNSMAAKMVPSCIEKRTYSRNEIILKSSTKVQKLPNVASTMNTSTFWSEDFSMSDFGTCFTFQLPVLKENITVFEAPQLWFALNSSLSYSLFIHDPNFFMLAVNPQTIPQIQKAVPKSLNSHGLIWQYISTTKHVHMNRADNPCNENPAYQLLLCIKESVIKRIGCRPEWEKKMMLNFPTCEKMEELGQYDEALIDLSYMEQKEITKFTGCLFPCTYKVKIPSFCQI